MIFSVSKAVLLVTFGEEHTSNQLPVSNVML